MTFYKYIIFKRSNIDFFKVEDLSPDQLSYNLFLLFYKAYFLHFNG